MAAKQRRRSGAPPPLERAHEWVSFEDPDEERTWLVDVTFLESGWECIFGNGCQGVLTGPTPELEQGCCSYGAHFTGEDDVKRVEAAAKTLSADQWQFRAKGRARGVVRTNKDGETVTRLVDDACIFLNRPGFPGGTGCALHRAALDRSVEPLTLKPDVCWQLPLRRSDEVQPDGHIVTTLTEWARHHWGKGGDEFAWWCTDAPEAFRGRRPVYESMRPEITEMTGAAVYELIRGYLDERRARDGGGSPGGRVGRSSAADASAAPVRLPHPAVRGTRAGRSRPQ